MMNFYNLDEVAYSTHKFPIGFSFINESSTKERQGLTKGRGFMLELEINSPAFLRGITVCLIETLNFYYISKILSLTFFVKLHGSAEF